MTNIFYDNYFYDKRLYEKCTFMTNLPLCQSLNVFIRSVLATSNLMIKNTEPLKNM